MRPTAKSGGSFSPFATVHARLGMIRYWAKKPTATALGIFKTSLKSATDSVTPMPSMITASAHEM